MKSSKMGTKLILYLSSLAIISMLFLQCGSQVPQINLQSYYLPDTSKVYVYQSTSAYGVEYMRASIAYDSVLTRAFYNGQKQLEQSRIEIYNREGVRLRALQLITNNEGIQRVHAQIKYPDILPFGSLDSQMVYVTRFAYQDTQDSATYEIIRNRRILGLGACPNNELHCSSCLQVELKEEVRVNKEGVWSSMFQGTEYYAKDVGLLEMSKVNAEGMRTSLLLLDQISLEAWNKMPKRSLD